MKFQITAEHTNGRSLGHPCRTGTLSDPSDAVDFVIECESADEATAAGERALAAAVEEFKAAHGEKCACGRSMMISNAWWNSVSVHFEHLLAAELMRDCPEESAEDHAEIAEALNRGDSAESILSMPETNRWPETYSWLRSNFARG